MVASGAAIDGLSSMGHQSEFNGQLLARAGYFPSTEAFHRRMNDRPLKVSIFPHVIIFPCVIPRQSAGPLSYDNVLQESE